MQQVRASSKVLPAMAKSSGAAVAMSEDGDLEEEAAPSWSGILRQRRETTGEAQQVPQIACTPEGDYWPLALRIARTIELKGAHQSVPSALDHGV